MTSKGHFQLHLSFFSQSADFLSLARTQTPVIAFGHPRLLPSQREFRELETELKAVASQAFTALTAVAK